MSYIDGGALEVSVPAMNGQKTVVRRTVFYNSIIAIEEMAPGVVADGCVLKTRLTLELAGQLKYVGILNDYDEVVRALQKRTQRGRP